MKETRTTNRWLWFLKWLKGLWRTKPEQKVPLLPPAPQRRKVDTQTIRTRITSLGWSLREIPVKRSHPDPAQRTILQWKLIAFKGQKSIEISGPNIDEAMKTIGQTLGVIPKG